MWVLDGFSTATLFCQPDNPTASRSESTNPPSNLKGGPMKFNANIDPKADARAAIEQANMWIRSATMASSCRITPI